MWVLQIIQNATLLCPPISQHLLNRPSGCVQTGKICFSRRRIVVSLKSWGKKWLEGCVQDSWEKREKKEMEKLQSSLPTSVSPSPNQALHGTYRHPAPPHNTYNSENL
ncbi:hypothetical protein ACLB2K_047426 [Fragaria x ananassa]